MPPQTRRNSFPRVIIERDVDSEVSSSGEEEEEEEVVISEKEEEVIEEENEKVIEESEAKKKGKVPITISLKKVCKVCKKTGHEAGFKGATYIDCPMKPCYLCKMPGHTTLTCPHRVSSEHGVIPAARRKSLSTMDFVFERQIRSNSPKIKPAFVIPDVIDCAVIRYHSRRITCLEFHPTNNNILLSGDKNGQLGVWDYVKVHEKTVYGNIHACILNNMRFSPANDGTVYTASSDGTISSTDLECGMSFPLMNLNPDGWQGQQSTWKMLYGMDINSDKGIVIVADNFGYLYSVDMRSNSQTGEAVLIHKKGTKVVGLQCNPLQPDLLLSCGNDHFARLWDMRKLGAESSLGNLPHGRVVNSAYFSPHSGSKILTTSQDNRIRVWDSVYGDLDSPSREIVHSQDFNRHLTPFRAEWDPKDPSESLAVIGRYISENYNGAALHPIDFIDTSTGKLVAEVMDPNITTISPVNKLHPRDDLMATGSSRSLFIWRPKNESELTKRKEETKLIYCGKAGKKSNRKFGGDNDSDDDSGDDTFSSKGKKSQSKKSDPQSSRRKSRKKLKLHKGKKFKNYEVLHELMGDEGVNGDNVRSVGHLIDKDIADDFDDIGIDLTKSVPTGIGYVHSTGTLPAAPTTAHATNTPSAASGTGDHTSTQTRRSTHTAKRQRTRPIAHVLDTGINVITTELFRITTKLIVRREFDWIVEAKFKTILRGIIGFDMTYLFTALEMITKEKPFCVWFIGANDETRKGYLRAKFGPDNCPLYDLSGATDE
ncbi:hypothetical protein GIB67_027461 [Kingdonia uniflora]|uniref:Protein DAMAGED DNA-BINDING 2 n=1 Tax=Kingdonia uniflora TaxID=39325 RepID=A0A7J7MFQ1_9MAGN|nr:hypothetical protein GIB67_027461 [Kingdonia uniflora]